MWKITKKELLANIITFRFTIGTLLFLGLIVLLMTILLGDYAQKLERYNELVAKESEELRQIMVYQNLKPTIHQPPEALSFFSRGIEDNLAKEAEIKINTVPIPQGSYTSTNPLLSIFSTPDITLIFNLVISLLILLLVYDAVSGEKEEKTLALILSNSIPRNQVLFSKFLGALITISIPITLGFLVVGLILLFSPFISLSADDWFRIALIYFVSLITAGTLCSIGLFISSITRQASQTLIILFFLWVVFIFAVPNLSTYLATEIITVESRELVDSQADELHQEMNKKINEFMAQNPFSGNGIESDDNDPHGYYIKFATKSLIRYAQKIWPVAGPMTIDYADKEWQLRKTYLEKLESQESLAELFSLISPLSTYENLISALSRSDAAGSKRFYEQAAEYRRQLVKYLEDKKAFSSIRYIATVKEEHLFEPKDIKEYSELREKYEEKNPLPLNLEDFPGFHFRTENVAVTVKRILPGLGLLSFTGILFFLCAYVAFLKYDVR